MANAFVNLRLKTHFIIFKKWSNESDFLSLSHGFELLLPIVLKLMGCDMAYMKNNIAPLIFGNFFNYITAIIFK